MSKKDMLGPLMRALVGVPEKCLGLLLDISNRLGANDADSFYRDLAKFVREWKKSVEAISKLIIRQVKVDRSRSPEQVIDATGRVKWYIDEEVLAEMPREGRDEDEVVFFELDYDPTVEELDREYEARGYRPDPYAVSQAMIDDPAFADERPVGVQWRDKRGRACCAVFGRDGDGREVNVNWNDDRWDRYYRFGGVRK